MLKICFALLCLTVSPAFANPSNDIIAINSGSATAEGGFQADMNFNGGATYTNAMPINRTNVSDPAPEALYQSMRYGNFSYLIPGLQAGASYTIRLHFAEVYWNTAGARVFQVNVNGSPALTDFDIFSAAGGRGIAVVREITAEANNLGNIVIDFAAVTDNAQVNGIELVLTTPIPPKPTPSYNLSIGADRESYSTGSQARIVFSLQNLPDNSNYEFFIASTFNGDPMTLTRITDTQFYAVTPNLAAGSSQVVGSLFLQDKNEARALEQAINYYNSEISRLTIELEQTSDPNRIAVIQTEIAKNQNRLDSTRDHLNQVRTPVGIPVSLNLNAQ